VVADIPSMSTRGDEGARQAPPGDNSALLQLLTSRFLNRTDRLAFAPPWAKKSACPVEANSNLVAMLAAHVLGERVPAVTVRWVTKEGKSGQETGHFRLGTYSPGLDGKTLFAVVDFDGGGHHGSPLADPLGAALAFWRRCNTLGLAVYLEKSGSGTGWHVWLFFGEPVPARDVRRLIFAILLPANLKDGTPADPNGNKGIEVFPKQDSIEPDGVGSMVWLPWWHGAAEGGNQFYKLEEGNLSPYPPEAFGVNSAEGLESALDEIGPEVKEAQEEEGDDWRKVESALEALSQDRVDGYDTWIKVGLLLHNLDDSDAMLARWEKWSQKSKKFKKGTCAEKWKTFGSREEGTDPVTGRPRRIGLGTLFRWAKEDSGWHWGPKIKFGSGPNSSATDAVDDEPPLRALVREAIDWLRLKYRTDEGLVWSDASQQLLSRTDFIHETCSRPLFDEAVRRGLGVTDKKGNFSPGKTRAALTAELGLLWPETRSALPHVSDLGPDSDAAEQLRTAIIGLWHRDAGLVRIEIGDNGEKVPVGQSLASMILEGHTVPSEKGWQRVHGCRQAWCRLIPDDDGVLVLRLAMRYELVHQLRASLPHVDSHTALCRVGVRLGCIDPGRGPLLRSAVPWGNGRGRPAILSQALSEEILHNYEKPDLDEMAEDYELRKESE
jgi:hypothetical protein